jgi:hypothetical protein
MGIIRILKPGLFIYECLRILFLVVYTLIHGGEQAGIPKMVFAVPGALFPLMALFLWLDISRYRVYLPLFTAGKCIGILSLLVWLIMTRRFAAIFTSPGIAAAELTLLSGDLFALAAVIFIIKNDNTKLTETQALEEN